MDVDSDLHAIVGTLGDDADEIGRLPDANTDHNDDESSPISNGMELMHFLRNLQPGQGRFSKALSMNRVLRVMISENLIPEDCKALGAAYSKYTEPQKVRLHILIESFSGEEPFFAAISGAAQNKPRTTVSPASADPAAPRDSVVVNRLALLAHAMVDARMNGLLVEYNRKITAHDRPGVLNDGAGQRKAQILQNMLHTINTIKGDVANTLGDVHHFLRDVHPENGEIASTDQLAAMMTSTKNQFDALVANITKSGTGVDGRYSPETVLQFCRTGKVYNIGEFAH